MEQGYEAKSARILTIYARFLSGQVLSKSNLALEFNVTERSIQRDIESLRCFLAEQMLAQDILYDRQLKGYRDDRCYYRKAAGQPYYASCDFNDCGTRVTSQAPMRKFSHIFPLRANKATAYVSNFADIH